MTNPLAGEFKLETPDKTFVLDFGINTMCFIEKILDKPAMEFLAELTQSPTLTRLRFMVWAGLQEHHEVEAPDEKAAGKIISRMSLANLQAVVLGALNGAMPSAEEVAAGAGDPPQATATDSP